MTVPIINSDLKIIDTAEATTNWSALGAAMIAVTPDILKQGSNCIAAQAKTLNALQGAAFDMATGVANQGVDMTKELLYIWVNVLSSALVRPRAMEGVVIYMDSATGSASAVPPYAHWIVGGDDVAWVGAGWRRFVVDANTTPDFTSGTFVPTSVRHVGARARWKNTALGALGLQIDIMHRGTWIEATGGTDASPIGFSGIAAVDFSSYRQLGVVTISPNEATYEINGTLIIGDEQGATGTVFLSENEQIIFADQPVGSSGTALRVVQQGGATKFLLGDSSGADESKIGFKGSLFGRKSQLFGAEPRIDFSRPVDTLQVYGTTFQDIKRGIFWSLTGTHDCIDNQFKACGQVNLGAVFARNLTFSGYDEATDAALLWNPDINIRKSKFLANTNQGVGPSGTASAIEHTLSGTFTYNALTFAGNDFDIDYSAPAGCLTIAATLLSNPTKYEITNGGECVDIQNSVNLTITVKDEAGILIENAQTAIYTDPGGVELMNEDTVAGVATAPYNYLGDQDIIIRVRKGSPGDTRYVPFFGEGEITESGFTLTVRMIADAVAT